MSASIATTMSYTSVLIYREEIGYIQSVDRVFFGTLLTEAVPEKQTANCSTLNQWIFSENNNNISNVF